MKSDTETGATAEVRAWHCMTPEAAATALGSTLAEGLPVAEAAVRLAAGGRNELEEAPPRPAWRMLADQSPIS